LSLFLGTERICCRGLITTATNSPHSRAGALLEAERQIQVIFMTVPGGGPGQTVVGFKGGEPPCRCVWSGCPLAVCHSLALGFPPRACGIMMVRSESASGCWYSKQKYKRRAAPHPPFTSEILRPGGARNLCVPVSPAQNSFFPSDEWGEGKRQKTFSCDRARGDENG